MDGRTSAWLLTIPLTMLCGGCITTQAQKNNSASAPPKTNVAQVSEAPKPRKDDGPKRNPQARTEIGFGKMKEAEADSEAAKKNPEAQATLRDEARKAYQKALTLDPNNIEASHCLGGLYVKIGDCERAQEIYKKAMAKHPKEATLWYDLGMCHNRRKDFSESVRCFTKALELDPENREYMKKLGFTLAWNGQVEQGLTHLTRAHGAALAHYKIACMFDQKEQREPAIRHLRIALRENGQLAEARDLLARLENPSTNGAPPSTVASRVQ